MFGNKQPKTVSQITAGLQKMVDELGIAQAQFEEQQRQNAEEIARREAHNADVQVELQRNAKISAKFKDLLGE